jgi:hypothetical protein
MHPAYPVVLRAVAKQQTIMHAHESPFYHYAQFPHPFAITYRGKKYSRILFGQSGISLMFISVCQINASSYWSIM